MNRLRGAYARVKERSVRMNARNFRLRKDSLLNAAAGCGMIEATRRA